MKRNLIAIAALGLALGTNAVLADNNYDFADPFWARTGVTLKAERTQQVEQTQASEQHKRFDLNDYAQ